MKKQEFGLIKKIAVSVLCFGLFANIEDITYAAQPMYAAKAPSTKVAGTTNNGDNYIDEVYQKYKQLVYWQKNYILVYIPQDERDQFVWSQFKTWENVLGGSIIFERVLTQQNADIFVHYENPYLGKKVGFTRLSFKDGAIRRADMYIYDDILTNPLKNFAVLHEIGHALGITNHSSNPADIMFATKTARQNGLSQRDKNTIKMLYNTDTTTIVSNIENNKDENPGSAELQQAEIMLNSMQPENALQMYTKILEKGKEKPEAYFGMAKCYYIMNKSDLAFKYAKKAIDEDKNNYDLLIGFIKIALDTNHHKELKKCLDDYTSRNPKSLSDGAIQSAYILVSNEDK